MELTQQERETLIKKALAKVEMALVCNRRGVKQPAEWQARISCRKVKGCWHTFVNLRPTNGILDDFRVKPRWKRHTTTRQSRRKGKATFVEIRTTGSLTVRIRKH